MALEGLDNDKLDQLLGGPEEEDARSYVGQAEPVSAPSSGGGSVKVAPRHIDADIALRTARIHVVQAQACIKDAIEADGPLVGFGLMGLLRDLTRTLDMEIGALENKRREP